MKKRILALVLVLGLFVTTLPMVPVSASSAAVRPMVSTGDNHTVALKSDGTVWAWGFNDNGQLGDGTVNYFQETPVQVKNLNGVIAVSAGSDFTVALKKDGTVWTWGANWATGQKPIEKPLRRSKT